MERAKGEGVGNYNKYIHHGLLDEAMFIVCNADGSPAAFPLDNKNVALIYSPNTPDTQLQTATEELTEVGFKGPFQIRQIHDIVGFGDAFEANLLLDAPLKEIGLNEKN